MDIKDIQVASATSIHEVDTGLRATRLAIATMQGQIETATQSDTIPVEQMSVKKRGWLIGVKSALRHAERIQEDLLDRREVLMLAASDTLKELITVLGTSPIPNAEKYIRDIKGIIPKLENANEE